MSGGVKLFKLRPAYKDYIWGGTRLAREYGKTGGRIAESWELSTHKDGESAVVGGVYDGKPLSEAIGADLPILIKLIDAREALSVQVHPDDIFAAREGQRGKTEMWLVLAAQEGAYIFYGVNAPVTREAFAARVANGTVTEILNKVYVKPGDCFFIAPGTVHAIGAGVVVAEVQQSSNVTYRLYDYGRVGADGKPRELHIEKGLACADLNPPKRVTPPEGFLAVCEYFSAAVERVRGVVIKKIPPGIFVSLLAIEGGGVVAVGVEREAFVKGDSLFIAAGAGEYEIEGDCGVLVTWFMPR